ncbi:MAG: hypothetical protein ACRD20_00615 [Terriglobales bacterium]
MTDDVHIDGHHEEPEFERQDLGAKPILIFLATLTVICLLLALVLKGMYSYLDARENRSQTVQNPLVPQTATDTRTVSPADIAKFPQPRLETNEPMEINDFRMQEEKTLHSYGWVDQQSGVVRIPIDRAMELVAQRGLPTRPQAGVAPPSEVNTVKEAARRSDTSRQPAKRK